MGVRLNSKVFHSVNSFETTVMRCADRSLWDTFCQNNSTQCKSGPSKFYFNCAFLFVRINSIQWKSGPSRFYFNCAFFFFRNSPPSEIEFGALLPRPIIIPGKMLCFLSCLHNERHIWQVIVVYMQAGLYWRVFALHTSIRYWIRSSLSQTHHHSWVMNKIVYMYVSGFS